HRLAFGVELAAGVGGQDAAHERVETAVPAGPRVGAFLGVGRDQDGEAVAEQAFHLDVVPVAGVGEHDIGRVLDACGAQLSLGGADHGSRWPKSGESTVTSAAMTICASVATAWAL